MSEIPPNDFERAAAANQDPGLAAELWHFLGQNKRWWMIPIFAVLLLLGVLIMLSGTAVAPFIYTLF